MLIQENFATMNSNHEIEARIIDEILNLLGDEYIYKHIVNPIEKIAIDFQYSQDRPVTYRLFINTIGFFVQNVYKFGVRVKQEITKDQARSIAYMILENGYIGTASSGFDAACLDAINKEIEGFELVLSKMTEILTSMEHAKHVRWVYENCLGHLDWETKCSVGQLLLKRMEPYLPNDLARFLPAQLPDHLEDLLKVMIASEKTVNKLLLEGTG